MPRVSVLMPVWNAGAFLAPAVSSILEQREVDLELLVADDGSSDGSDELLRHFARTDSRVRLVYAGANEGIATARNRLLIAARESSCPFIAFLNHDDLARPERLHRQIAFLEANSRFCLLGATYNCIDARGYALPPASVPLRNLEIRWRGLLECPLRLSVLTLRASLLDAMENPRFDPAYEVYSDFDFVSRALHAAAQVGLEAAALPEMLGSYRRHPGGASVRRRELMAVNGASIARTAIARELPEYKIDRAEIGELQAVFLGLRTAGWRPSLPGYGRVVETYLDLLAAFQQKHRGHPDLKGCQLISPDQPARDR